MFKSVHITSNETSTVVYVDLDMHAEFQEDLSMSANMLST